MNTPAEHPLSQVPNGFTANIFVRKFIFSRDELIQAGYADAPDRAYVFLNVIVPTDYKHDWMMFDAVVRPSSAKGARRPTYSLTWLTVKPKQPGDVVTTWRYLHPNTADKRAIAATVLDHIDLYHIATSSMGIVVPEELLSVLNTLFRAEGDEITSRLLAYAEGIAGNTRVVKREGGQYTLQTPVAEIYAKVSRNMDGETFSIHAASVGWLGEICSDNIKLSPKLKTGRARQQAASLLLATQALLSQ